jgi:DNA repair protein RecO (recombination protein O)
MTQPRNYKTEAIILKKTKLGEADRILTLYTPHLGKIQAIAKGVRRPRSKMSGHLELITHSLVPLVRGKNLDTITGSQTIHGFLALKSDLRLSSYALYIIELVNKFTEENIENYSLFKLLLETLKQLEGSVNSELVLRFFELHLLSYVGYRPQLQCCVLCHSSLKRTNISFSPRAGGMLCPDCNNSQFITYNISQECLELLRLLQECDYETVNHLEANQQSIDSTELMMRNYMRYYLEREIKSITWLDSIRKKNREGRNTSL